MKNYIYTLIFTSVFQFGYSQLVTTEISPVSEIISSLSPYEKYTYLFNHTVNTPGDLYHFYGHKGIKGRNPWIVFRSRVCFAPTSTTKGGCNFYYNYYAKFYKDVDGDGYGDSNDFIVLRVASNPYTYNPVNIIDSNVSNINVIEYSDQATDIYGNDSYPFSVKILSCNYDGYTWVNNSLGVDCDDTNPNIPSSQMQAYFQDHDNDGYGGARYSENGNPRGYKVAPADCPPLPISHYLYVSSPNFPNYYVSLNYSSNNEDCYDYSELVTTDPINWYLDEDGDGYGNSSIFINSCQPPGSNYRIQDGDCDDQNAEYNVEEITWYADFDDDGFGDESDSLVSPCPVEGYIRDCYFDDCPTEAGKRTNGCPLVAYDFDNENQNYNYERVYLKEYTAETIAIANNDDVLKSISYKDNIGRIKQKVAIGITPEGKDVMQHIEYDGNGQSNKSYLPIMNSNGGMYESDALARTLDYYNTSDYENTTNPYSETITEASPLNRVLEQGAPGEDWLVDTESDYDHTIKYEYDTNTENSIKKFSVIHSNDFSENTELNYDGFYANNELSKTVVKNENWEPNQDPSIIEKNNTEEAYTNHLGQTVLKRAYVDSETLDTYYVYDDLGNLTYVLPPEASDQILEFGEQAFRVAAQTNYSWVNLVSIDKEFAEDYNKQLSDYENSNILTADIENKYGGQGGFTVTTYDDNELVTLSIDFSSQEVFELKQGQLVSLKPYGEFKDTEIGVVSGTDYKYVFYIKDNAINVEGGGKLNGLNHTFNSATKLEYDEDYLWVRYSDVDEKFANEYEEEVRGIVKNTGQSILDVNVENQFNGQGGLNVTIDNADNVTLTFNSNNTTELKLKQGVILSLKSKRKLQNRDLGIISGTNFEYRFSLVDNSIFVRGFGGVTAFNGTIFSPNPPPPPEIAPQTVEGLSYIYHYDYRNRIVEKKTPDKGWEHIVYNKLDQPVLTQDAKMRLNSQWQFIKYDPLGRPIYSGLYNYEPSGTEDNAARIELQDILDNQTLFYESITETPQTINDTNIYYTNATYPISELELHSITYYDDYNSLETNNTALIKNEGDDVYDEFVSMATNNLPTHSKTRVLGTDTDQWITSVIYYDEKATPIYVASENAYLNTLDLVETDIDFTGKVLETKSYHSKRVVNCGPVTEEDPFPPCSEYLIDVTTVDKYTYDRIGRLLTQTQTIEGETPELIVNNTYNDLGQLISKKVGGTVATSEPEDSPGLQKVDYSYNIRGWLKAINDGTTNGSDLFGFKLNYNSTELNGATALYNGNISETHWIAKSNNNESVARAYNYNYDALNRLRGANYHPLSVDVDEDYSVKMNYDKNGNIVALARIGQVITNTMVNNTPTETVSMDYIDILSYSYGDKSNQLNNVKDTATKDGFMDGNDFGESGENDYTYDINGNLIKDINKEISITYNHLNLPVEIKYGGSNEKKINYIYSADGRKLSKVVTYGEDINTSLYAGKFIYQNNALKMFSQPEGYAEPNNSGGFDYVYQYKDHLGNIRLSYKDENNNNQIEAENEIVLVKAYYPFGLEHQGGYNITAADANTVASKFKYNGTELEESFGVNLYEMPFRQYDPAIARWTSIDPVTHFSMSPYTGFDNNPVYWSDPSGADSEGYFGKYDLEWGGYMMEPDDPNFSDWGQSYGSNEYFWSLECGDCGKNGKLSPVDLDAYGNPFAEFGFEVDLNDTERTVSQADFFGVEKLMLKELSRGITGERLISEGMRYSNLALGAVSTNVTYKGKYHLSNELYHKSPSGKVHGFWEKGFNSKNAKKVRAFQTKSLTKIRSLSTNLTRASGALIIVDIALSGELKPSHGINGIATGLALTGFGAPIAAVWFIADFGTMGINYLINGEAKGIGDMIDESVGTYHWYEGFY